MAYDNPRYQSPREVAFIRATFAGALKGTTAGNTNQQTSANLDDRLEFFNKIKLTGFKALSEVAADCGSHNTSQTVYMELCQGTVTKARATVGTVAGVMADGTIVSANIESGTACNIRASVTGWDGTVQTMAPGAVRCIIQYQERL